MSQVSIIPNQNFDTQKYNSKSLHPMQSWEWGKAKRKMGIEILRIGEWNKNKLINVYLLTFQEIPYTKYKIGYLLRSSFPSNEVLYFLKNLHRLRGCIFVKIEANLPRKHIIKGASNKLIQSSHHLLYDWTIKIDLRQTEEEILKKMKQKTRYNIRLAQKKGIYVQEMTNWEDFKLFTKLYFETCKRKKFYGHNYKYHKIIFETLRNKIAHILIAFYKNIPLAAYEIFVFNNILYYPFGGSTIKYHHLMASHLLMWETIRFGKKNGAKFFDMWGVIEPKEDKNHLWAGLTRFKQGFGGEYIELAQSFDLVIDQNLYKLYNFQNVSSYPLGDYGLLITREY